MKIENGLKIGQTKIGEAGHSFRQLIEIAVHSIVSVYRRVGVALETVVHSIDEACLGVLLIARDCEK